MDPFTVIAIGLSAVGALAGLQLWFSDRQWVTTWRGHRVHVQHHQGRFVVCVDDEVILSQHRLRFGKQHTEAWSHPALGETTVAISRDTIGHHGEYTISMTIGDERLPLAELPRKWHGARTLIGLQSIVPGSLAEMWEGLSHTTVEPLGDARWLAACRLLELSRQSNAMTPQTRQAANHLQGVLRRSFEARLRLGDDAVEALGEVDQEQLAAARTALEARIQSALEAVKSLHMAMISIESQADETHELSRVHQTLAQLQAEDEVERFTKIRAKQHVQARQL